MPITLYESGAKEDEKKLGKGQTSIVAGVVTNNFDCIMQGKVLVRIPALDQEVWARLTAMGAGAGTGYFRVPSIRDEVLVALVDNDPDDAYVIGGLWGNLARPPILAPTDAQTKLVIRTGVIPGVGHEIEFDDAQQSILIKTSTGQTIRMSGLTGIQIMYDPKTMIVMTAMGVQVTSGDSFITMTPQGITLGGKTLNLIATTAININAAGGAGMVKIN